jgi:hypothetical protein
MKIYDPNDPQISDQERAKLKRLYPYSGANLPDSVRQNARDISDMRLSTGWFWDNGGPFFQCVLHLCDIDAETIDPAGHAAIRPLGESQYALEFVLWPKWADGFYPRLIFHTMLEAQRYLDTLLGVDTPQIPRFETPFETA